MVLGFFFNFFTFFRIMKNLDRIKVIKFNGKGISFPNIFDPRASFSLQFLLINGSLTHSGTANSQS